MVTVSATDTVAVAARPRSWRRRVGLACWALALTAFCLVDGLPVDRATQTLWILGLLFAVNVGRPWRVKARILLDWLPFVAMLYVYDYTRGLALWFGAPVHAAFGVDVDRVLGDGHVPTVALQHALYDPARIHWWDVVASVTYFSHFVLVWVIAAVLYLRSRAEWTRWVRRLLLLSYLALLTFVAFPAAPPWYAAKHGLIAPVARITGRGWESLGLHTASTLIERGQAAANDVAAIPSLHASLPLLITVFFWRRAAWWLRAVLLLYTATMAFSLVYGGEHYVTDVLIGYAYVAVTVLAARAWELWRVRSAVDLPPAQRAGEAAVPHPNPQQVPSA